VVRWFISSAVDDVGRVINRDVEGKVRAVSPRGGAGAVEACDLEKEARSSAARHGIHDAAGRQTCRTFRVGNEGHARHHNTLGVKGGGEVGASDSRQRCQKL